MLNFLNCKHSTAITINNFNYQLQLSTELRKTIIMSAIAERTPASEIANLYPEAIKGKVAIVTGSNSGIGFQTAKVLASHGAKVIITCRSQQKCQQTIDNIKKEVPDADLVPLVLELESLDSVRSYVKAFLGLNLALNLLINNAGIMAPPYSETVDGFETQWGVNHLGHFLLTYLLMDKLAENPSRVVILSSVGHYLLTGKDGIKYDRVNDNRCYNPWTSYGYSKLANVLHAQVLQRKFDERGADVLVTSVHPGGVDTGLQRHSSVGYYFSFLRALHHLPPRRDFNLKTLDVGASTTVYCAVVPGLAKGRYYSYNKQDSDAVHVLAQNTAAGDELWAKSLEMLGLQE